MECLNELQDAFENTVNNPANYERPSIDSLSKCVDLLRRIDAVLKDYT